MQLVDARAIRALMVFYTDVANYGKNRMPKKLQKLQKLQKSKKLQPQPVNVIYACALHLWL